MKRITVLAVFMLPLIFFVAYAFAAPTIIGCKQSHINFDDPIVFPGRPGASHQHIYAGSRDTNAFSTVATMQAAGTTCSNPGDTAGAWSPTFQAGYPIHDRKGWLIYYRGSQNVQPFPPGLKMVVRWSTPGNRILFKCQLGSANETRTPCTSSSDGVFVPVVTFPNFWNGRDLDSPDHLSHMSYSRSAAFPIEVPRVKIYARFAVPRGTPINPNVSSGDYTTYHMDYFATWKPAEMNALVDCLRRSVNCGL